MQGMGISNLNNGISGGYNFKPLSSLGREIVANGGTEAQAAKYTNRRQAIAAGLTITGRGEESDAEGITRDTRRNPFVKLTVIEKGTEYELNPQKVLLPNGIHATKGEISDYGEFEAGKVYNITLSIPVTGHVPDFGADAQTDPGIATSN